MGRDEKIRMDREKKVAEEEAKYATTQFARGEINEHAFHSKMFKLYSYNALRELSFVDREIQILEFRKKLEEDQEVKEQYEREISKPLGKPKAWRIPVTILLMIGPWSASPRDIFMRESSKRYYGHICSIKLELTE